MSEDKGQQEPSMEDILASIRRILSEDDGKKGGDIAPAAEPAPVKAAPKPESPPRPAPPPPPPPRPEPEPEPEPIVPEPEPEPYMPEPEPEMEPEPEPLALLPEDMIEEEPEEEMDEEEADEDEDEDVLDLTNAMAFDKPEPVSVPDPFEDFPPLPPEPEARPMFEMDSGPEQPTLSNEELLERTTQDVSEQAFASLASVLARRNIGVGQLGVTLEELVRELLRPILKAWLDENLPHIVERIVEREVERIVNRIGPMK
jgi:hypothetical protein